MKYKKQNKNQVQVNEHKTSIQKRAFSPEGDHYFNEFMAWVNFSIVKSNFFCKELNLKFWANLSKVQAIMVGIRFSDYVNNGLISGIVQINRGKKGTKKYLKTN